MKRALFYIGLMWKPVLFALVVLSIAVVVLGFDLAELAPGYSAQEIEQYKFVSNLSNIVDNPVNSPVNLIQHGLIRFGNTSFVWLRVVTCFFALIGALIFYILLNKWYTHRIALLSSAMYLSSSWVLMTARTGLPNILLILLGVTISAYFWLNETKKKKLALLILFIGLSLMIYIPGGILFLLAGLSWKGKKLFSQARKVPVVYFLFCLLVSALVMAPLLLASYRNHDVMLNALGFSDRSFSINSYLSSIWANFLGIFVNSSLITGAGVGKTGILDIFSITLLLAGAITAVRKYGQDKMKYLLIGLGAAFLLSGINEMINITIVMPFLYLLIGTGLAWLLRQWFVVFPRNPIAKNIGVVLVIIGVAVSVYFNTYRYYVAWPHMSETNAVYNQKP